MKEYLLKNNLKIVYKKSESELTSICISLDAGAGREEKKFGIAHATEHMIYKSTKKRNESQINKQLNEIFGFQNAMTNYPYAIYYGTLLNEDFERGIELFADILINPVFPHKGFKEEMDIIKQELEEWDEESDQYCEDKLFLNSFDERRIKYPIIGIKEHLEKIQREDIIKFYDEYYFPENTTITIVSNMNFEDIIKILDKYFGIWREKYGSRNNIVKTVFYENPKIQQFSNKKEGIKNCRGQLVVPIDKLTAREMKLLRLFNEFFGEGVNSILYDTLRTKKGLVYDVQTHINDESYIKMYKIIFSAAKENADYIIELIKKSIDNLDKYNLKDEYKVKELYKSIKLKKLFKEEKGIIAAKELGTYEAMFGSYKIYEDQFVFDESITFEEVVLFGKKLLQNLSVELIE